jgi:hypothetical protein
MKKISMRRPVHGSAYSKKRLKNDRSVLESLLYPKALCFALLHFIFITKSLLREIFRGSRFKSFFILNVGGFAHTVMQAEIYFEFLDPNGKVILIYTPNRHNPLITTLYSDQYTVVDRSKYLLWVNVKDDRKLIEASERLAIKIVELLSSALLKSIKIFSWKSIVSLVPKHSSSIHGQGIEKLFFQLCEGTGTELLKERNLKCNSIPVELLKVFSEKQGENTQKYCAFYFRSKGNYKTDHVDDYSRNSRDFSELTEYFACLKSYGYKTLVYGDLISAGTEEARNAGAIFCEDIAISRELWNLWVPIVTEFTIGAPGGGLIVPVKFLKPILVMDGFGYFHALPNALMTYKLVKDSHGNLISPFDYIRESPWLLDFPSGHRVECLGIDIHLEILAEFILALNDWPQNNNIDMEIHKDSALTFSPGAFISKRYSNFIKYSISKQGTKPNE